MSPAPLSSQFRIVSGMFRPTVPLTSSQLRKLRSQLLTWYDQHRRELPWRADTDPYRVWVSEIMLQQTRVAAVVDHYARWMKRFPTIQALAAAREPSVLAAWSGLGYYHRARRMHQAAKVIVRQRQGRIPRTAEDLAELPGIGRYTAAAIASIAFGQAVAVVDGNVERVLNRLYGGDSRREVTWQRAESLLSHERPGDFNQAMMELGATLCTPLAPQCLVCPLTTWCVTRGARASQTKTMRKRKKLFCTLATTRAAVFLVRRTSGATLMANMWELPPVSEDEVNCDTPLAKFRHSITDTDYEVSVIAAAGVASAISLAGGKWFTRKQWERLPLTGLARKILRQLGPESEEPSG